jgi:hypothetical protein
VLYPLSYEGAKRRTGGHQAVPANRCEAEMKSIGDAWFHPNEKGQPKARLRGLVSPPRQRSRLVRTRR